MRTGVAALCTRRLVYGWRRSSNTALLQVHARRRVRFRGRRAWWRLRRRALIPPLDVRAPGQRPLPTRRSPREIRGASGGACLRRLAPSLVRGAGLVTHAPHPCRMRGPWLRRPRMIAPHVRNPLESPHFWPRTATPRTTKSNRPLARRTLGSWLGVSAMRRIFEPRLSVSPTQRPESRALGPTRHGLRPRLSVCFSQRRRGQKHSR